MHSFLVVGGAGGVGSAVVERLAGRLCAIDVTVLEAAEAASIEARYQGRVRAHVVDLSDADTAQERIRAIVEAMPSLDAVVVCAAIAPQGPMELVPLATFRRAYEINCVSAVSVYQAVMPALRNTGGRIVLLGSLGGRAALPFLSAYMATKFALEGLCDVMRREAAPQGVAVSLIQPGAIRTGLIQQQVAETRSEIATLTPEQRELYGYLYERFLNTAERTLEGGASTPDQIADVVMAALDAEIPETRYVAGDDAKELLGAIGAMSDRQVDALLDQMFSQEP